MQQIYRRTPTPKCDFTLWHGLSPLNLLHIFRTSFPKNTFLFITKELIKLFYSRCSCEKLVQKLDEKNLKVIKNALPSKSANPESLKK